MNEFINNIKAHMEANNITAYKASQLTGLSKANVYKIFNGDVSTSMDKLLTLADGVGLNVSITCSPK